MKLTRNNQKRVNNQGNLFSSIVLLWSVYLFLTCLLLIH